MIFSAKKLFPLRDNKQTTAIPATATSRIEISPFIKVVHNKKLYVSKPDPAKFGNGPNESNNPKWTNKNWLKSRFHFSFAEYRNPANTNFGVLRVMNDDEVQPHRGFGAHPHRNMEIVTYVVNGELSHQDSMGTKETLGRGSIQFMTAGTGVRHSEFNHGDKPLRFVQTWITPSQRGLSPKYGSFSGDAAGQKNQLQHLVSDVRNTADQTPVKISQDTNAHAAELDMGKKVAYPLPEGRQAYLLCLEGTVKVNGKKLRRHDACEIVGGGKIEVEAIGVEETENGKVAHFLMFSMKEAAGL